MVKTRQPLWTLLMCSILAAHAAFGQSTLTQIRDTVVNADGTPFNGTVVITWNGSTGSNTGTTPLSTSARIYSGALSVLLVPTTTASAGAFYQAVYYSSNGVVSWTETWQVPPSTSALTLSNIRTSTTQTGGGSNSGGNSGGSGSGGTTNPGGGQYATLPISISQVTSLSADLSTINSTIAALTAQINNLNSLGPVSQTNAAFVDTEVPGGTLDGSNAAFSLAQTPAPAASLKLYRNGLLQSPGIDYSLSGSAVTFVAASVPHPGDVLSAYYRVPGTAPLASFTDSEIPGGMIDGNNAVFTLVSAPAPAVSLKLYKNGVLLTQNADYTISGSTITFSNASVTPQPGDALIAAYRH